MRTIPQTPGIYKIRCIMTDKVYIGSSVDLRRRSYEHWKDLSQNCHHSRHLQNAWNKYGADAFIFEVVELIMFVEHLFDREQYWMDFYRSNTSAKGFNEGKCAKHPWIGRSHSDETRQKLSERTKANLTEEQLRAAAEWHGSDEGFAWHSQKAKKFWAAHKPMTYRCDFCGADFQTNASHNTVMYCSALCKNRARQAKRLDHVERWCVVCGASFFSHKRHASKTCSARCRAALRPRNDKGLFT